MRSIAEMTAGATPDEAIERYFGASAPATSEDPSEGIEHIADVGDIDMGSTAAPGFPEHLEKLAEACDNLAMSLEDLPKTAALYGDPKADLDITRIPDVDPCEYDARRAVREMFKSKTNGEG
jgi:hypothetical protein